MEHNLAGTDEGATPLHQSDAPAQDDSESKVEATLARLRAEHAEKQGPSEAASFVDKLDDAGIDVKVTQKPEAATDEPAEAASTEIVADAVDELLESVKTSRVGKVNAAQELQARLEAKGMKRSLAKAMAHHGSRKDAEEFLASFGDPLQSEPAGQSAPERDEAAEAAAPAPTLAEVQAELDELTGGEETASAVTRSYLAQMEARLAAVEGAANQSASVLQAQKDAELRATAQRATGELQDMYPQLVRDGKIDPAVMQTAAALYERGHTQGDLAASIKAACPSVYGSPVAPARQTPTDSTPEPELSAPDDVRTFGNGPIDVHAERQILTETYRRYAGKPEAQRKAALAKARKMIDRRNAAQK